jgi:PEP-CTERM motif
MSKLLISLGAAAALLAATAASAVPVIIDDAGGTAVQFRFGDEDSATSTVDIDLPTNFSPSVTAGEFKSTINGNSGFYTFCLELEEDLFSGTPGQDYTPVQVGGGGEARFSTAVQQTRLDRLYANHYSAASTDATGQSAAAFQLLLWEIVYEGTGALDLLSGTFALGPAGDPTARATAIAWGSGLDATSGTSGLTFFELLNVGWQDLLYASPDGRIPPAAVPEPGSLALLGLGALAAFTRSRKRA